MIMIGNQGSLYTVAAQQTTRDAGILAGYEIRTAQNIERPKSHIGEIADGSGDEIKLLPQRLRERLDRQDSYSIHRVNK